MFYWLMRHWVVGLSVPTVVKLAGRLGVSLV